MYLDITKRGDYLIEFKNQNSLKIWNTGFPFVRRFYKLPIEKQFIQIYIKQKNKTPNQQMLTERLETK